MTRINAKFAELKKSGKSAFVSYIMAGDPNLETSQQVMNGLPKAGVDIIELGLPFTDPMADGPAIQLAGGRALDNGMTLASTLDMVRNFRKTDDQTPIVLMGYYNPIYNHGVEAFVKDAVDAGIDALIVVDLPPEEDDELCIPANDAGLHFIRLATPTTDTQRLPAVLQNTSGFIYYVAVKGITGAGSADVNEVAQAVSAIKSQTDIPVCVGFGIKSAIDAKNMASVADGAVVGSAIVEKMGRGDSVDDILAFVTELANGAHSA